MGDTCNGIPILAEERPRRRGLQRSHALRHERVEGGVRYVEIECYRFGEDSPLATYPTGEDYGLDAVDRETGERKRQARANVWRVLHARSGYYLVECAGIASAVEIMKALIRAPINWDFDDIDAAESEIAPLVNRVLAGFSERHARIDARRTLRALEAGRGVSSTT